MVQKWSGDAKGAIVPHHFLKMPMFCASSGRPATDCLNSVETLHAV